jgi:hypothetical protein
MQESEITLSVEKFSITRELEDCEQRISVAIPGYVIDCKLHPVNDIIEVIYIDKGDGMVFMLTVHIFQSMLLELDNPVGCAFTLSDMNEFIVRTVRFENVLLLITTTQAAGA